MRKLQEYEYKWMVRLKRGPLVFLPGKEIFGALAEAGLTINEVRRYMPVQFQATPVKTEEEERALKIARQERLILARAVKKVKMLKAVKDTLS